MASQELCPDMIFEILSRTALSTLDTCKCLSKELRHKIEDQYFMHTYCTRTNTLLGFFIQACRPCRHVSQFVSMHQSARASSVVECMSPDMQILASCSQGILCCVRRIGRNYRYYAGKPTTRQWQALPNPKLRYRSVSVCIRVLGSSPLHYKIFRLSNLGFLVYQCEVFDSKAWTWKETQHIDLPASEYVLNSTPSVHVGSCFHWLTSSDNVLAFDEVEESFHLFPLPKIACNNSDCRRKTLVNYQSKLGLIHLTEEGEMEIWLREYGVKNRMEWKKDMEISIDDRFKYLYPIGFYTGFTVMLRDYTKILFYNLQDITFSTVDLDHIGASNLFLFRSDSECVNLRTKN